MLKHFPLTPRENIRVTGGKFVLLFYFFLAVCTYKKQAITDCLIHLLNQTAETT